MSGNIINTTDHNFKADVLDSEMPVLVDFWAPWCGPCRMIAPVLEELSKEYAGRLKVVKLNTDDNIDSALDYRIRSIPTLGIFVGGKLVDAFAGAVPKQALRTKLDKFLAAKVN